MNAIQDTLESLHRITGIKGGAVVTLDGLVAAESLDDRFSSDVVGGLASFLLMTMNRSLREGGLGDCRQFMLHATHGKVILTALDEAYLVVIFDQFADVATVRSEVAEAATRIRHTARLSSDVG
ncbi:MAG: roadblock/LC7 domain-containing protein [Planctomycetes bacterium]|nr:roadblock/LC7 domain-containing protein [Planctomycetota bacterium]